MVKSKRELEELDKGSTDIFHNGLIQYYSMRPDCLENISLAEFASWYRYSKKNGAAALCLQHNNGYIYRRTKPIIIRYRNYRYETEPDEYCNKSGSG